MKAAYITQHGGPEVLQFGDLPEPKAGPGEALVDIVAASVNGADWKVRIGGNYAPLKFPHILGRDFSGTVAALGPGVTDLKLGDAVFGVCDTGQEGAYAEKIAIKSALLAKKPSSLGHAEAAALALTGLTALVAVEDTLKLKRGETILIQGGAGGVAAFAIQLAKHIGARVITTARTANHDYVRSLGADLIIDYTRADVVKRAGPCDAAFDTVGGEGTAQCFAVLKPGGRAAFIAGGAKAPAAPRPDLQSLRPAVGRDRPHLERIVALVQAGAVRPPEIRRYKLSDAVAAHRVSEGRHFRGKLVFEIR